MDILESAIFSLTSDEVRRFKILSNRFKADDEKKLIVLFDAIRSEKYADDDSVLVAELYGENNPKTRNTYYRLRNKLLDNIEKSLVFYHFKYKDSIHAYYDIQLSIMYRERGNYRMSEYFLKKAAKKARALDQFNILEQIYEEYTQLAIRDIKIDIRSILEDRRENQRKVEILRKNSEAVALITQTLKASNFSRSNASVIELLNETRQLVEASAEIFNSPEGKIQIFRTVSALLLQKEAFGQLVEYLDETIEDFEQNKLFSKDTHSTRLLMRIWLILALVKVFRLKRAEKEVETLEKEMKMYGKQNYYAYLFNYYNIKINLLKVRGKSKESADLIREALDQKELRNQPENILFLQRSLADHQFNSQRYLDAVGTLARVKSQPAYKKMGDEVRMCIEIFDFVVHYEAGNYDFIASSFKEFKKTYRSILKSEEQEATRRFVEILVKMNTAKIENKQFSIKTAFKNFKGLNYESEYGDNHIIMYDLYLQSQVEGRPYYDLFLENIAQKTPE